MAANFLEPERSSGVQEFDTLPRVDSESVQYPDYAPSARYWATAHTLPVDFLVLEGKFHAHSPGTLGPVFLVTLGSPHRSNDPAGVPQPTESPSIEYAQIEAALGHAQTTQGVEKVRAQADAVQAIIRAGATSEIVDHAVRSLIGTHRSGRLQDAIDILTQLGGDAVRSLADAWQRTFAPNGTNDDCWYAVIRAAARTGNREIARRFLDSRFIALEEAAVEALGDIGDAAALEDLGRTANDLSRPQFIRELAQELLSDLA